MYKSLIAIAAAISVTGCSFFAKPTRPDNPVVKGIHYVGVSVSDIEHASAMFAEAFDLKTIADGTIDNEIVLDNLARKRGVKAKSRLMSSSNGQVRLMQFEQPSTAAQESQSVPVEGPGFAHICVQVNQNTEAYQTFLAEGGTFLGDQALQQLNPRNPVYYGYALDHDNIVWEIEHVDVDALELDKPPTNQYRLRHIALATPDIERLVDFYSTLLETKNPKRYGRYLPLSGEKLDKVSGVKDAKIKMAFFQVRNMEVEMTQFMSHPTTLPKQPRQLEALGYNMVMFDVVSLAKAREKLLEAGGTVESESKTLDGAEVLFGRDPDGNLLGFQVLPEDSLLAASNFKNDGT